MNERVQTGLEEEKLKYKRKIENIMKGKSKNLQDFLIYSHDLSLKIKAPLDDLYGLLFEFSNSN